MKLQFIALHHVDHVHPVSRLFSHEVHEDDGANVAFMTMKHSQLRLDSDVQELLSIFVRRGDCRAFLQTLPMYVAEDDRGLNLNTVLVHFEMAVECLLRDHVNSTAALSVRSFFADTLPYPLLVLLVASGMSTAIPPVFYVDLVATLLHSTLNKHAYVKLGRFKSKSRHWWVGTADVGEGKSVAMKDLVDDLIATLARNTAFAVGTSSDRFHYQQSGTTAGAVDKLRTCEGYLTVYCPDAGRCLSAAAAKGGKVDVHEHINIEFFLDAAHGAEFNHSTKLDRQRVLQKPRKNPREAVASIPPLHIDPTNITLALMQQDLYFQEWWAQIARAHPVGIPQRCLLSFGGDMDPVCPQSVERIFQ